MSGFFLASVDDDAFIGGILCNEPDASEQDTRHEDGTCGAFSLAKTS
jgi:hypothetical protein